MESQSVADPIPATFGAMSRACPRCDGVRTDDLPAIRPESSLDWHECRHCGYLWATPIGTNRP